MLEYNDLITVKKHDFYDIKEHDIITFWAELTDGTPVAVTHEVVEVYTTTTGKTAFRTKGINIPSRDRTPVTIDGEGDTNKYIGKYVNKSSFIGNLIAFLTSTSGIITTVINTLGLCVIWYVTEPGKKHALF